jgi:hypothetical protein
MKKAYRIFKKFLISEKLIDLGISFVNKNLGIRRDKDLLIKYGDN